MANSSSPVCNRQAVVIGGSIAGLVAAKVLLNHFQQVTLIERDRFPAQPTFRPGVPQSQHVHALLVRGQRLLDQLFPGIVAELHHAGAPAVNWTADWQMLSLWGWFPQTTSDLNGVTVSRVLLEWLIYQRLQAFPNLTILEGCQVKGLLSTPDCTRVVGVNVHHPDPSSSDSPSDDAIAADLVVDASGRNSALPKWLIELGYEAPQETVINSFLGYASRWYQKPQPLQTNWKGMTLSAHPPEHSRGGVLFPVEGDRWIVTLGGMADDQPPTDEEGFLEFARRLRDPAIYDAIKDATPLSPVYGYRRTENCWRHYEQLTRLPEGIVALGDAVCAFNPVYGQGMTTAALGALTLDQCLTKCLTTNQQQRLTPAFQKQLARVIATPWMMATAEDGRWHTTTGPRPKGVTRLVQRYMDQVIRLAVKRPALFRAFAHVIHLVEPPTTLFRPDIVAQVAASSLNGLLRNGGK
jgi:2-polyprenyl-6-methoxyphenol hydroxylase-like FAD-dependent oxidoreductase